MDLVNLLDLRAGLDAAEATTRSALERRETRDAHNRSDFPTLNPALHVNLNVRMDPSSSEISGME